MKIRLPLVLSNLGLLVLLVESAFAANMTRPFELNAQYLEGSSLSRFEADGVLNVFFPAGKFGPHESGYNFAASVSPKESAQLSYEVRFSSTFDFVKGGKLPGLCGGKDATAGKKPVNGDGFSSRVMWRTAGRAVSYVYHLNQVGKYGDDFQWQTLTGPSNFSASVWHKIVMDVSLNDPSKNNGSIIVSLDGERVFAESDFIFRKTGSVLIDRICFNTFFGGSDLSWAPKSDQRLQIRNLKFN